MSARRTVALVVVCAAVFSAAVVTIRFATSDWDATMFARVGDVYGTPGETPKNLTIVNGIGYDGQFYYRLALDPFSSARTEFGISFDKPGRRQQRILYPLLAWIFSGGGKQGAVPWSLILINAVVLVLIALVGTALVRTLGRSPWWGLAFALVPGALVSLTHDTGDALAILLSLSFLVLFRKERFALASAALTAAVFTRETTLVFAFGLLVAAYLTRRSGGDPQRFVRCALVPVVAFLVWQILLGVRWGAPPVLSDGGHDIGPLPLYGVIRGARLWFERGARVVIWNAIFASASVAFLLVAWRALKRSTVLLHERAAFTLALILIPFLRSDVWFNFTSYLRAMSESMVLGLIVLLSSRSPERIIDLSTEARASARTPSRLRSRLRSPR